MNGHLPWFRFYHEAIDDDKLRLLAFEDRWHFVALLCCKAQGMLEGDPATLDRRIAVKLGLQLRDLDEVKRRLMEVSLINESWEPIAWEKRQCRSDSSAERVRKWRQKQKDRPCNNERNVTETLPKRNSNAIDIEEEVEKEEEKNPPIIPPRGDVGEEAPSATDSKTKPKPKRKPDDDPPELPEWLSPDLWATWRQFRKEIRVPMTPTGEKRLLNKLRRLRDDGHDPEEVINRSIENSWRGFFETQKSPPSNIVPIRKSNANDPTVDENDPREQAIQRLLRSPCPLTRREAEEWADEKFQRTGSYESC